MKKLNLKNNSQNTTNWNIIQNTQKIKNQLLNI